MNNLQQYVPTVTTQEYEVCGSDNSITVTVGDFHPIVFGMDEKLFSAHKRNALCTSSTLPLLHGESDDCG